MSEKSTEFKKGVTLKVITRKRTVKFLSFVLALLVATSIFPLTVSASAATTKNEAQVLARINDLSARLGGKFFTTTGRTCGTFDHGERDCSVCDVMNVAKTAWLKNALGGFVPDNIGLIT
ncbi:MAG: hypothetical protein SOV29_06705, partial [Oscillospiraceae bacterium]|nr:hypothetical protein [Oscillospiraceae bacterium]